MFVASFTLRNAMMAAAMWLSATKLRSSFSYRTSSLRNRLSQLWQTSTTQRRALLVAPRGIGFLVAINDVGDVAVALDDSQGRPPSVPCVGAQVLAAPRAWCLALDHDGLQNGIELRDVMRIRSCHDERQRDATPVHQQVGLAPLFSPDRSGCARPPLAPVGP